MIRRQEPSWVPANGVNPQVLKNLENMFKKITLPESIN